VGPALDAGAKLKQVALPGAARSINYRFVQLGVDPTVNPSGRARGPHRDHGQERLLRTFTLAAAYCAYLKVRIRSEAIEAGSNNPRYRAATSSLVFNEAS
jgi:hypothetical protein